MSKRLTIAVVGCAALVGCGVVAVRGNEGDAAVEPARAAVVSPQHRAPQAVLLRSAPKLPALAPRRLRLRDPGAAAASQAAAAQPSPAAAPPAAPVTPTASAQPPVAPAPATPPPTPPAPAPAPKPAAPPVDFLSSG
jgi:hypothetical protein